MVQGVSRKKRLLVRFQDGCENNLSSNQPAIMIVKKIPEEEEPEVFENPEIPEKQVDFEKE